MEFSKVDEWGGLCEDGSDGEFVWFVWWSGNNDDVRVAVNVVDGHGVHVTARAGHAHGGAALAVEGAAARALVGTRHLRGTAAHHHGSR